MPRDINRRTMLKAASTAGIVGVAGCSGGGGGGGGSDGGGGGGSDGGGGGGSDGGSDGGSMDESEDESGGGGAEYSMTLAGPYTMDAMDKFVPMMFKEFKSNVESESGGKISVNLAPAGELGVGTKLAQKVQQGTIEAAQFSMSNFSPFAPAVDLVNIPYFAGKNQQFVNLVTSDFWKETIHPKVNNNGYTIAYYVPVDPRSLATGPNVKSAPTTPAEVKQQGIKHRIPGSQMLQLAWKLAGANPTPIDWGETPQALQEGVADTTHNAFEFHPAFGFTDILNHEILIKAVEDAQVIAINLEWYNGLPEEMQSAIDTAGEKTFKANLEAIPQKRKNAYNTLSDAGVEFVELGEDKLQQWKDAMGYQRSEWDDYKKDLAGDMKSFEKFEQAARTKSDFDISAQTIPN